MNLTPLQLAILLLATYRWTLLLHNESGPAHVFDKLRARAGVRYDKHSNPYGENWIAEGFLCPYCLSVWVGVLISAALFLATFMHVLEPFFYTLLPFALSGGAVYLKKQAG